MAAVLGSSFYFCVVFNTFFMSLAWAQGQNEFIYHGFNESHLHLDGVAEVLPNGLLQLTNGSDLQSGHAFYPFPFQFNKSSPQSLSFSTNFVFAIEYVSYGMAFVISPSLDFSKASVAGSYLGVFNISNNGQSTNHVLVVELDTEQNPEFEDIDGNHVGIDVNSVISVESAPASYFLNQKGKKEDLFLSNEESIQIWIDYNATENLLNVTLAPAKMPKPSRPLLSKPLDLSRILEGSMYVGFSAATDTSGAYNYVLGWSFNRSGPAQNLNVSKLPSADSQPLESERVSFNIVALISSIVLIMIAMSGAVIYIVKRQKYEEVYEEWEKEFGFHRFSYKNLYKATKGFKESNIIGKGGFGKVYRAVLPSSNIQIAVKKVSHDSKQGMKEFVAEIVSMGRLRHRNLVQLRGYCRRRGEFLLVYDYMPNGSLDTVLYSKTEASLNWCQRFRIIRGVASGLLYLHEEWEQVVLHRDIKPGNILLDADLNARLGDFGLARLHDHGSNAKTTKLVGTFGYLAPELIMRTGKATTSTDVYAFGVFLLEVACGRRPVERQELDEAENLVYWVTDHWKRGSILDASDPRLQGVYGEDQMELVLKLGLLCSHSNPAARPSMRQVMQYLDGDAMLPDVPDSIVVSSFAANDQATNNELPFPSFLGNVSVATVSTNDSILAVGR